MILQLILSAFINMKQKATTRWHSFCEAHLVSDDPFAQKSDEERLRKMGILGANDNETRDGSSDR